MNGPGEQLFTLNPNDRMRRAGEGRSNAPPKQDKRLSQALKTLRLSGLTAEPPRKRKDTSFFSQTSHELGENISRSQSKSLEISTNLSPNCERSYPNLVLSQAQPLTPSTQTRWICGQTPWPLGATGIPRDSLLDTHYYVSRQHACEDGAEFFHNWSQIQPSGRHSVPHLNIWCLSILPLSR